MSTVFNREQNFINHQKSRKTVGGHRPSTILAAITWVSMVILGAIRSIALVGGRWLERDEFIRGKAAKKTTGIQWNHNKGQRTVNANNWQKRNRIWYRCAYTYILHTVERNVKDCHPFRFVHTKLHNGYKTNRGAPLNQNNYLLGWVHLQQTRKGLVINTLQQHCMKKVSVLLFYSEIDFAFFTSPWDVIVRALLCNPFWNAFIWNAYYHYGFGSICFDIFSLFLLFFCTRFSFLRKICKSRTR